MSKTYIAGACALSLLAVIAVLWQSSENSRRGTSRPKRSGDGPAVPASEQTSRAPGDSKQGSVAPITALAGGQRGPVERMLDSPEFASEMTELLHRWERETVEVLQEASEAASDGKAAALILHLPAFGDAADTALREFVAQKAKEFGAETGDDAFEETLGSVRKKFHWPKKSRLLMAVAEEDGTDSVVVFDGAGPESVELDAETGKTTITSSGTVAFSEPDLAEANRFSHLLNVREEGSASP